MLNTFPHLFSKPICSTGGGRAFVREFPLLSLYIIRSTAKKHNHLGSPQFLSVATRSLIGGCHCLLRAPLHVMIPLLYVLRLFTVLSLLSKPLAYAWINYPSEGTATLTHYDLPKVRVTSVPDSRRLTSHTGLYCGMRMHWEIYTLPDRGSEPNGVREQ